MCCLFVRSPTGRFENAVVAVELRLPLPSTALDKFEHSLPRPPNEPTGDTHRSVDWKESKTSSRRRFWNRKVISQVVRRTESIPLQRAPHRSLETDIALSCLSPDSRTRPADPRQREGVSNLSNTWSAHVDLIP